MPVISDEEAGQIIHSLEITPPNAPNAGIIDLGLDEFNPIPNINPSGFFDLSFLNEDLGMFSHKKSLITIFVTSVKSKLSSKNLIFFIKKFQQPSILSLIWNKIANFESKLHKK